MNKYHLRTVTVVTDDMLEKFSNCIRPKKNEILFEKEDYTIIQVRLLFK